MSNSRQKGKVGEDKVLAYLKEVTGLPFDKTPGSGSGLIKGDLHIPGKNNMYCIEVKNYAESPLTDKILVNKTNNLVIWWNKLKLQSKGKHPLLIFRYNRSVLYVATHEKPSNVEKYIDIPWLSCYIMVLSDWIEKEDITWVRSAAAT